MLRFSWASVSADQILFSLCALVMVSALVLGGGTANGFLRDVLLQLLAIPLLILSLWRLSDLPPNKQPWGPLAFCVAIVLVPLLQLIPLPPAIWTALPNREPVEEIFDLLGRELSWMPLSVSPHATWLSALSLLVPLSIFLGTLLLDYRQRRLMSVVALSVGLLSVFLGLTQVAQLLDSWLRFFASSHSDPVGFFANRNHFAAFLYTMTLLATAWVVDAAFSVGSGPERKRYPTASILPLIGSVTVLVVLMAAQVMTRSRAGFGLTIFALFGAFAIAVADKRSTSSVTPAKLLIGATALAVAFTAQFAFYRIMERFTIDPLHDARLPLARTTIEAAQAFMPFGAGMGTFVPVYAMFEKPADLIANIYTNRAHNDVLELWLEAGIVGLALLAVFAIWFILRSWEIWRRESFGVRDIDQSLARAATLIVVLLIAHSLVDYPLRTGAMMAIMAFACGLMIKPALGADSVARAEPQGAPETAGSERAGRKAFAPPIRRQPSPTQLPSTGPETPKTPSPPSRVPWGQNIEWPEEWRKPHKQGDPHGDDK